MANPSPESNPGTSPFQYVHSPGLPGLLERLGLSLLVTTYQAGKLMVVRSGGGRLSTLLRSFEVPMGLAVADDGQELVLGTRRALWTLRSEPDIAPQLEPRGKHDACYVPRRAHVTGHVQGHEIALVDGEIWLVNTLFSCLCSPDPEGRYSFLPRWRPPFIDRLAGEDRCHLNGVAVEDGQIRYLSALGETNTQDGWREGKVDGGILIDFASGETVLRGLCMPHSPRVHDGRVLVLDSGKGELCAADLATGTTTTIAALPGYARGLACHGRFAFVGLSQVREKNLFRGLPITERTTADERRSGLSVVDLQRGEVVEFLHFEAGCSEIFDVQTLAGRRWPSVVGFQGELLDGIITAPPGSWDPASS